MARVCRDVFVTGSLFIATAWLLENRLYFNAGVPEKSDGPVIVIIGVFLAILIAVMGASAVFSWRTFGKRDHPLRWE